MASAMQIADPVRAVPVKFIAVGSTITNVTWLTATNGRILTLPPISPSPREERVGRGPGRGASPE